ncbi:MAG: alpha/beta hydrolase [Prosthecobacter sp.]|nr:alpha/beta hydrolase [Prosthecobacter sp.]
MTFKLCPACLVAVLIPVLNLRPSHAADPRIFSDIEYASIDGQSLKLDLYLPEIKHPALVVWVHGGAWRGGSKSEGVPSAKFVAAGYAVASVDYRLSPIAPFPAQIHDIKAAVRFLRARAGDYGFDPTRMAIAGSSAGGHLAALAGVTNNHKELEGTVGNDRNQSSEVRAIVSLYGASNLMTILAQSQPKGLQMRVPALQLLLGGQPKDKPNLARLASPVAHVDAGDPPLLLIHGDADPQMPPEQSHELAAAYTKAGASVTLEIIPGAVHGGTQFYDPRRFYLIRRFLDEALR